ncbi:MAG: MBL fold metallo-hydrolase [Thermodesulfobacteria bacterium]|nr:MBL fold metallo-hydrolase [Thermodesulfobacteriota bacterium]
MVWLVFLFLLASLPVEAEELKVYFLDVGEGEAVYFETPHGQRLLLDTGNLITGYRVACFLAGRGVKGLSRLIVSHAHPDHAGGIFLLLRVLRVDRLHDNGGPLPDGPFYRWYAALLRHDPRYGPLEAPQEFVLDGVRFRVLWPRAERRGDLNADSLVLKVSWRDVSFLFMADAHQETERALLSAGEDLRAQVLQVGHHGARDATSRAFLQAVSPRWAVIPVGRDDPYGRPHPEVLRRLRSQGVRVLRTSSGTILFRTDGRRLKMRVFGADSAAPPASVPLRCGRSSGSRRP